MKKNEPSRIAGQSAPGPSSGKNLIEDPFKQFDHWYQDLIDTGAEEPSAMILSTATSDGKPSSRVVLMKQYGPEGFVFYTNYQSRKGSEITANPFASILFYWQDLGRQVRIEGAVQKVSTGQSDEYFHSRPVGSRISAAISPQSRVIPDRFWLIEKRKALFNQAKDGKVDRPEHWGGFRLAPAYFEFWQAGDDRLHERVVYKLIDGIWERYLLAP